MRKFYIDHIAVDVRIPEVTARQIKGIEGLDHRVYDVHIVAVEPRGLIVAGDYHTPGDPLDKQIVFCVIKAEVFYTWAVKAFYPDHYAQLGDVLTLPAAFTYWASHPSESAN